MIQLKKSFNDFLHLLTFSTSYLSHFQATDIPGQALRFGPDLQGSFAHIGRTGKALVHNPLHIVAHRFLRPSVLGGVVVEVLLLFLQELLGVHESVQEVLDDEVVGVEVLLVELVVLRGDLLVRVLFV